MSGTTSVPRPTWDARVGFKLPTEQAIIKGVLADLQAAFGGALNPAPETPQGQLASTQTAIIADTNDQFLFLTQQVDPAYSSGRFQDGIGRIYFIERYPARATVVQATCTGIQGVTITAGARALAKDGNYYVASASGKIGADGTVTLPFTCSVVGPIDCPTGSLNQVYNVIPGWEAIVNRTDGVVGQNEESRAQFERRRFDSVAGHSLGMLASVHAAVLSIPDVFDVYTTENVDEVAAVQDGVTLPPHSLYVCTVGGTADEIANAIFTRKSPGCNTAGSVQVTVQDTNSSYSPPYPTYSISYQPAADQTIVMNVTLINSSLVPPDSETQIQAAVMRAWIGADGGTRAAIGSTVFASRYYAPVASVGSWVQLKSIKLGHDQAPTASFIGAISGTTLTVSAMASGSIGIGDTVIASDGTSAGTLQDGTQVTASAPGTIGGVGTYTLSLAPAKPITSQNMISIAPGLDDVQIGIAHVPVLSADNISVTLVNG